MLKRDSLISTISKVRAPVWLYVLASALNGTELNMRHDLTRVTYIGTATFLSASRKSILNNRSAKVVLFTHY